MAPPDDTPSRDAGTAAAGSDAVIEALQAENALLRTENAALREWLADLERRLGLNSSNSSGKPPSSDGLKWPPRVSRLAFWDYLGTRLGVCGGPSVPRLPDLIRCRGQPA